MPVAIDTVLEKLLVDVIGGGYPPGARLPAERELAETLGASRPTLREALRRLADWRLIEVRGGSGIAVRPYREWSIEVVPAYFRYGKPTAGQPAIARVMLDVLELRRAVLLEIVTIAAPRVTSTIAVRVALGRAWDARAQPREFPRADFEVTRALCEAAQFTPALWLLNRLADVWFDAAGAVAIPARPPADYVAVYTQLFDRIDRKKAAPAAVRALLGGYLERHDRALIAAMQEHL